MNIPKISVKYVIPLILVSVIGTAAAQIVLFTHTFPQVTVAPPPAVLTTQCSSLVAEDTPILGTSGNVTFDCGNGVEALDFTGAAGRAGPVFIRPTEYSEILVVTTTPGSSTPSCTLRQGLDTATALTSASSILLPSSSPYVGVYCALYTSAPSGGFPSFTIEWDQITF